MGLSTLRTSAFETEEEMVARIEAEERARLEFEDMGTAEPRERPVRCAPNDETDSEMRRRIEVEERARLACDEGKATPSASRIKDAARRFAVAASAVRTVVERWVAVAREPRAMRCSCAQVTGVLILAFVLGATTTTGLSRSGTPAPAEKVDFEFQILGIHTPRQFGKTLNVFVRFRYASDARYCPFSPTDNLCPQYQLFMRDAILNLTTHPTPELPMPAEWERVNLAMCRTLWGVYPNVVALSTALHVNGDGRNASARGDMPYEPGAHGTTCTIGGDAGWTPIQYFNRLPNLGPY